MEKTFANATLLSTTVLVGFMIMIPISHLSAQNEIQIDEKVRMHKAIVEDIDWNTNTLTVNIDGAVIPVVTHASTTVSLGNGDETLLPSVRNGASIYVLGYYDSTTKSITADRIILRNKSITERTSLSRAELEANKDNLQTPSFGAENLSVK